MNSLDKIRCEYEAEALKLDTSGLEKDDALYFIRDEIKSLSQDYRDIRWSIFRDKSDKFLIEKANPILERFGFEIENSHFLDQDITFLEGFSSSIGLYKRMYQLLEFNLTDDNYVDIYRLAFLLLMMENESTIYYQDLLKGLELSAQGIVYVPAGSDYSSLVFDFFREELYGNILAGNKGKVKEKK